MVPHQDERGEPRPSEAAEVPGDRLQQEQQKELASLDQQDASDTEMDEKVRGSNVTQPKKQCSYSRSWRCGSH